MSFNGTCPFQRIFDMNEREIDCFDITFSTSLVGLCILSVRRAVFVTGISSNMTIDFAENNASTTSVGSRDADAFRAFVMRGGVTATYMTIFVVQKANTK